MSHVQVASDELAERKAALAEAVAEVEALEQKVHPRPTLPLQG